MGRFLVLWEIIEDRIPASPQEIATGWSALLELTKEDIKKGKVKIWGVFAGELRGFSIFEGTELEVAKNLTKYAPYIRFQVNPFLSTSEAEEVIKSL
jgi:hypothetical protein